MASTDEENAGDVPPAILMLRNGLKNLTRKVDGLLRQRNLEVSSSSTLPEQKEALIDMEDRRDRGKELEEERSKAAASASSSDSESGDEGHDEDMVDLFVSSLRAQSGLTSTNAFEEQAPSESRLKVSWVPNTGLPSSTELVSTNLESLIKDPEKTLQDGLFVPTTNVRKLNKIVRKSIPDTAGSKWFNMAAQTLTPELKRELQLIKLRGALDPKRHYKKDDTKKLPKYFQIGTVVEGPGEFYSSRLTKAERKATIAEELLADANVQAFRKRKFAEIMERNSAGRDKNRKKGFKKRK